MNNLDLTGKTIGRLLVLERIAGKRTKYKCVCACGQSCVVRSDSLRALRTQSCGCYRKDQHIKATRLPNGIAAFNSVYHVYKYSAKDRNLDFLISESEFLEITQKSCYYCGTAPANIKKWHNNTGNFIYNGIDRVDNTKGYILDNIVSCCRACNLAKHAMTQQDFIELCCRVASIHRKE